MPAPVPTCGPHCTSIGSVNFAKVCGCGPTTWTPRWAEDVAERVRVLHTRDDDPVDLASKLWDLSGWVRVGHQLLDEMASAADVPARFGTAAAMVRHLLTDPVLPGELLPDDWPGAALREAYNDFAVELISRRDDRPT